MSGDTLNGEFLYVLLISIVDAAILSWIALRWYRRSIARIMAAPAHTTASRAPSVPAADASSPVAIASASARSGVPQAVRGRVVLAYVAGTTAFAVVTGSAFVIESGNLVAPAFAAMIWAHAWPIWPALSILLVYDRRQTLALLAIYLAAGACAVALATVGPRLARGNIDLNVFPNIYYAAAALVVTASVSLALVAISGLRRVRAVMPLALAGTMVFGIGLLIFRRTIVQGFNVPAVRSLLLDLAGASSTEVAYYALYLLIALPFGWCAWRILRAVARGYGQKRFSDVQLIVDCWFAVVTTGTIAMDLVGPFGWRGVGIGVLAFVLYRVVVAIVLRLTRRRLGKSSGGLRLLMLRVFGFQSRTEELFDQLTSGWRFHGSVQLIGGTDLAMRTADPGEMLSFMEGRLMDQYVSAPEDISARLERLDFLPDPDGRFRVNDIYCLNDTWRGMFEAVLSVTDRVVMDLRGFSATNAGCRFELEQLVQRVDPECIVLVTDRTTDNGLLHEIVAAPVSMVPIDDEIAVGVRHIIARLLDPVRILP